MTNKNIKLRYILFFLFPIILSAQNLLDEGSTLPLIVVDTYGVPIPNEPKTEAHLGIIHTPGQLNFLTDPYNVYDGRIGIEIRGNGTVNFEKVSYLFETQLEDGENNNVSLLGFPKENDWVLYGPFIDKSLLRNIVAYDLARDMGYYSSRVQLCELVLNDEYIGVYVFMEKIKRDKDRVDIKKFNDPEMLPSEGGFLFKIDSYWNSSLGWQSGIFTLDDEERKWNYHYLYPKVDDITEAQKVYIKDYVDDFENKMLELQESGNTAVYDLIDVENFADYFIINELAKNPDAYRLSTYFHKDADEIDGRLKLGPVWDYNFGFGYYWNYNSLHSGWEYDNHWWNFPHQIPTWWTVFLEDPYFVGVLKDRWSFWRNSLITCTNFTTKIDHLESIVSPAADRNFTKWPILGQAHVLNWYVGDTYAEEVDYLNSWICQRILWMDQELDFIDTSIPPLEASDKYIVYPNPTTDHLVIQSPDTLANYPHTIRIFDLNKVTRWEEAIVPELDQTKITLSLPDLAAGLYIFEISYLSTSTRWKVVIK